MTWVHDSIYAAGGDYLPSAWAEFQRQTGVRTVIHLREEHPDRFSPPFPSVFLWLAVVDEASLTHDDLLLAARVMDESVRGGGRVLLHCHRGMQRTRPLYAAYRVYNGKSVRAAIREVEERPWVKPYRGGQERMERFAAWLAARSQSPEVGSLRSKAGGNVVPSD